MKLYHMCYFRCPRSMDKCVLFRVFLAVMFICFVHVDANFAQAGQFRGYKPHDSVEKYEIVHPKQFSSGGNRWRRDVATKTQRGHHLDRVTISVFALGRKLILDLALNRVLMPVTSKSTHFSADDLPIVQPYKVEEHCYYQGTVKGMPDSSVAVSTCEGLEGLIFDGKESYYIEPVRHMNNETSRLQENHHIFYNMKDLRLPPTKCGHDHLQSQPSMNEMYKINKQRRVRRNVKSETKYVELIIVNDFEQFDYFKRNLAATQKRARTIANLVDSLYRHLNIRVALVDMVTWNRPNPIEVVANSDKTLDNFLKWRNEVLIKTMKKKNDNAHLLTHLNLAGATVGKAHVSAMCTARSAGVVQDHAANAAATAATFAHEMGHNLGMSHDEQVKGCECEDSVSNKGCIMSGVARSIPANKWSTCSRDAFYAYLEKGFDECLFNEPGKYFGDAVCGNGFKEEGEECDCGTAEECGKFSDKCCNSTTCKMLPGSECESGPCCSQCKLMSAGTECREKVTECDLPESCDGKSSLCPANRFVHNSKSCGDGKGYCFNGVCPTLDEQCQLLWGSEVKSGPKLCYTVNMKGAYHGSCGRLDNNTFVRCKFEDIYCGMLHCTGVKIHLPIIGAEREVYTYTWPKEGGGEVQCKSVILDVGNGIWNDAGMTKNGIKCGDEKVCFSRRCRNVTEVLAINPPCPKDCSNNGVCNNYGDCFCNACWTGKDCSTKTSCPGQGASSSSVAGIVFLVFFIILIIVLVVVAYIKRDLLKTKWQKYKQSRSKRYASVQKDGARRTPPQRPDANSRQISAPVSNAYTPPASTVPKPLPSAPRPVAHVPPMPAPGKIELPSWPQDSNEDSAAAVPVVKRRPPPPRPTAPKGGSLNRASSPPGFVPSATAAATRPTPATRPGSLAGVLDRKPLPGTPGRKPAGEWPPLNKASSDGSVVDRKPTKLPPAPPTRPGKPVLPVFNQDGETSVPMKPSEIKKAQGNPAQPSRPSRPPPGKPMVPGKPVKPALPPIPPGVKKS